MSTTLKDLESAAGKGLTGGGTLLPMSDVIRLARHAHHYLAIFDTGKAIGLYHTKQLASPGSEFLPPAPGRTVTPISHIVDTGSKPHDIIHYLTQPSCGQAVTYA